MSARNIEAFLYPRKFLISIKPFPKRLAYDRPIVRTAVCRRRSSRGTDVDPVDTNYYLARAEQEKTEASRASDPHIASIHLALAEIYLAKSRANGGSDPTELDDYSDEFAADEDNFRQIPQSGQA